MIMSVIPSYTMQSQGFRLHWTAVFIVFINHLTSHGWCSTSQLQSDTLKLSLTNSGPSVFDSNTTFTAVLSYANGTVADKGLYNYSWQHNAQADHILTKPEYTEGYHNSTINKVIEKHSFIYIPVPAGNYTMYVTVWPKDNQTVQVASGSTNFTLTDTLNMDLQATQTMGVPLPPHVFCTCKNITLTAIAQDEFTHAKYEYTWSIPGEKKIKTSEPTISFRLPSVGNYTLKTDITANVISGSSNSTITKKGTVQLNVTLKDGLSCVFNETPNLLIGNQLQANVTCTGSPKYTICANITAPDGSVNTTCRVIKNSRKGFLSLDFYKLKQSGSYTLSISAVNVVSEVDIEARIDVGGAPQSAGVVVGCILVAIVILAIIGYAYYYDINHRDGRSEETADFNFHPWHHYRDEPNQSKVAEFFQNVRETLAVQVAALKYKYNEWSEQRRQNSQQSAYDDDEERSYPEPSAPSYRSETSSIHSYGSTSTVDT